ncbi:autism susceptibility gene 2 protein-like [Polyodon spathula]|uniref:autism susceptibility gene 2 protein-like n=1 Tax=Polyodon spathula TaxID=7913 RepID=UPI001B7EB781|nr:autism susceptibility gene 2 protein-like [Polyodon spathula]
MEGSCRGGSGRQSRRSRSQRDRERRRRRPGLGETRAYSPSSGSEPAGGGGGGLGGEDCRPAAHNNRPRPPRRRKRESVSSEEDLIDCFAIASFISLEALEGSHCPRCWGPHTLTGLHTKDSVQKPLDRSQLWERRGGKRKRPEENGPASDLGERREGGGSSERERERANGMGEPDRRVEDLPRGERGACRTDSRLGRTASDGELDHSFTVSTSRIPETAGNGLTPHDLAPRLSVTPRVSGIQRSQERNHEADSRLPKEPLSVLPSQRFRPSSPSLPKEARRGGDKPPPSPSYHGGHIHPSGTTPAHPQSNPSQGNRSTPQPRSHSKGLLQHPFGAGVGFSNSRSSTPSKTPTSSSSSSSTQLSLHRPSTPSGLALSLNPPFPGGLRPPSHPGGGLFTPSPGLPPPPPLLQVTGHPASGTAGTVFSEQDLIRQELNSRFLTSQTGGGAERTGSGAGGEGRGPAAASAAPPGSGTASGPLAFQYHQHNHQHQHTHTHQHYTPFLPPSATATAVVQNTPASPMFQKYPGKMDGLYRHNFYPTYPPSVSGLPPVLPPAGTFSSLQGAFQPKTTNQEIAARLGAVPHPLQQKDPRLTDPFRAALRVSNKPGKWCAMHVRVAWMILRHQEKVKHMQADPHKPDFRNDLITRVPGSGLMGPLSSAHDLSRPSTLFSASGAVHHGSSPFAPPTGPLNSFLNPPSHLVSDPFGRSPTYTPLGSLGSAAFGGLGSPNITPSSMFAHKDAPGGSQGFSNPHDPWNRLHRAPASFPTAPTWPKGGDGERGGSSSSSVERERERERENDKRVIKDEKERDGVYGRHPVRRSPVTPNQKCAPPTTTPPSSNGHGIAEEEKRGGGRDSREHSRDRERGQPSVQSSHQDRDRERLKEEQQKNANGLQNENRPFSQSGQHRPPVPDTPENSGPAIPTSSSTSSSNAASSSSVSNPVKEHAGLLGREGGSKLSSATNPLPLSSSSSSSLSTPAVVNSVRENGRRPGPPTSAGSAGEKDRDHKSLADQILKPKKAESCPITNSTAISPPPPPPTPPPSLLPIPLVKVKEERKEEPPEPIPIPIPPSLAPLSFDRPNSRGTLLSSHHLAPSQLHPSLHPLPSQGTSSNPNPSSVTAAMGLKFSPVLAHHHPAASSSASSSTPSLPLGSLSMLERTRALGTAYLGGPVLTRPSHHHHHSPHQYPHSATSFSWNLQEVLQQQQQQQQQQQILAHQAQQRREMAFRDPQIARFFAAAAQQRFYEQERVGYVRDEFGGLVVDRHPHTLPSHPHLHPLHPHHHHHERVGGAPGSSASSSAILNSAALLEENERAQILREDFERARFYGAQAAAAALGSPHPHLQTPSLFSRLGPGTLYSHHHPHQNGLLSKTPPSMVGPPPPLIPSGGPGSGGGPPRSGGGSPRDNRSERGGLFSSQKGRDSR